MTEGNLEGLPRFAVGQEVHYKARINNPGHYKPHEMLVGRVITVFKNGNTFSCRLELDKTWREEFVPGAGGKKIIVGNVFGFELFPIP